MRAEIIAIGSELLGSTKIDTNSLFLTRRLASLGIEVTGKTVVGDDREHLEAAIRGALGRAGLVITTGGLGPTRDDVTREAAAAVTGRQLLLNDEILYALEKRYRDRGMAFLANNRCQAYMLDGAIPIPNGPGAAPGAFLELDGVVLVMLPGVPREMSYMVDHFLMDRLRKMDGREVRQEWTINLCGIPESVVDHRLQDMDFESAGVRYTILANMRRVQITLSGANRDVLRGFMDRIRAAFPHAWYAEGDVTIEQEMLQRLKSIHATLGVAESCTGGLLGSMFTDNPGSSAVFMGGVIAYHNRIKKDLLGVDARLLETHGAVSGQVAAAMATGIRRLVGSDFGLAVTGIAGPTSDGAKPVGLVYVAVAARERTAVREHLFKGTREMIRIQSATRAVDLLRRTFFGASGSEDMPV